MLKTSIVSKSIKLSLVRTLFNEAKKYPDIIDLTLGDPDVPTHKAIKEAACDAILQNRTRYSQNAGLKELRDVISENYREEGLFYDSETEVIVTVGAMESLYLAFLSLINPGDEVIIPAPYYVNYAQMVRMCHGVPVIVDSMDNDRLSIDITKIEQSISPKTKAIVINTPCNPSGKIISQEKLCSLAEIASRHDLAVITDEVYKCLIYDGRSFHSISHFDGMKERTIIVNSLSKEFCMTGYRIGYTLAPSEIIASMTKLQENIAACAPLPSQYAAIKALSGKGYSYYMSRIFTERRKFLFDGFSKIPLIRAIEPEATFYMMVDISKTGMKSVDFCYRLLREAHVAVVPGISYGECCDDFIRIAFTKEIPVLNEGLGRIEKFLNNLR